MSTIHAEPLTAEAFAPFGDVLDIAGAPDKVINAGWCDRYHDRATLDFGPGGRAGISLFRARPRDLPYECDMLERHPEGSQAFIPMAPMRWLVIVAPDADGRPGAPRAFLPVEGQAVNFHRGTWHGVLTPLAEPGLFAVIDRIGDTPNLQECFLDEPFVVIS
ncbi:ureidoglycolate lyase [Pseudooceanicola sp. LIPI14-2-Ac024]|uniref:ureidoglycolate lyase n=1 Tax=Pseudooceanicola sp. LIPI14-2-Ac024 TaxID=3344875 RepID=UPI0035CE8D77